MPFPQPWCNLPWPDRGDIWREASSASHPVNLGAIRLTKKVTANNLPLSIYGEDNQHNTIYNFNFCIMDRASSEMLEHKQCHIQQGIKPIM